MKTLRGFIKKADIILAAILIAASVAGILLMQSAADGTTVTVRQNGQVVYTGALGASKRLVLEGDYTSVVLIENGQAGFVEANCPNHDCIKTGMIGKSGQSAACLPNRVVITISGGNGEVDDIAQ